MVVFVALLYAAWITTIISAPVLAQHIEQRIESKVDVQFQDLDRRITSIEQMKIGENLAELKTAADYNKTILIGVAMGVLGLIADRVKDVLRQRPREGTEYK